MPHAFKILSAEDFFTMTKDASVIEQDRYGAKVFHLSDGTFLKIFRVKRLLSSAVFYPYSLRFVRHSEALSNSGIPTLLPLALYRLPEKGKSAVHYEPIPGKALRQVFEDNGDSGLMFPLGQFVAGLHEKGIYFRSLHLGNIILTPEGRLGLIDIADMRIYKSRLGCRQRIRNLMHLCRIPQDRILLNKLGWQNFCGGYFSAFPVESECARKLNARVQELLVPDRHV